MLKPADVTVLIQFCCSCICPDAVVVLAELAMISSRCWCLFVPSCWWLSNSTGCFGEVTLT